jgi:hypothetical protein
MALIKIQVCIQNYNSVSFCTSLKLVSQSKGRAWIDSIPGEAVEESIWTYKKGTNRRQTQIYRQETQSLHSSPN